MNLNEVVDVFGDGSSFSQSSCKVPSPLFREIPSDEYDRDDDEVINTGITSWTKDLDLLPQLSHKLINDYFVHNTIDIDKRSRGANKHKVLGYQLFKENYVKDIKVKSNIKAEINLFVVKCFVAAAMKKEKYVLYIHLCQCSGEIIYAKCLCKAGAGGCCKHVAAALYQLVEYKELNLKSVPIQETCTEKLQTWHVPGESANKEAILFSDLTFEKANLDKDKTQSRKRPLVRGRRDYCSAPNSSENSNQFMELCENLKKTKRVTGMQRLLEGNNYAPCDFYKTSRDSAKNEDEPDVKRLFIGQIIEKLTITTFDKLHLREKDELFVEDNLMVSTEAVKNIEEITLKQSETKEWYLERSKRITSSNFGAIINRRTNIFPSSILKKLLKNDKPNYYPPSCKWGLENEEKVLKTYEKIKDVQVESCGFIINPKWPWLGCSPDGVVNCEKAIEIKCPYSKKEMTLKEACKDKNFYCYMEEGQPRLKSTHPYFYQCQGIMAVCSLKEIDFIVYTEKDLHIENIKFDDGKWNSVWLPILTSFYFEFMAPKLFQDN